MAKKEEFEVALRDELIRRVQILNDPNYNPPHYKALSKADHVIINILYTILPAIIAVWGLLLLGGV